MTKDNAEANLETVSGTTAIEVLDFAEIDAVSGGFVWEAFAVAFAVGAALGFVVTGAATGRGGSLTVSAGTGGGGLSSGRPATMIK